jgi:hypothetical protein
LAGADLSGSVAACGADEFLDAPAVLNLEAFCRKGLCRRASVYQMQYAVVYLT